MLKEIQSFDYQLQISLVKLKHCNHINTKNFLKAEHPQGQDRTEMSRIFKTCTKIESVHSYLIRGYLSLLTENSVYLYNLFCFLFCFFSEMAS